MKKAPDFTLPDQYGSMHSLSDYYGQWLVLYFYPQDETHGCTQEACHFRDAQSVIAELGNAKVVGISPDSVESHKKFAEKHKLNFTILSDPDHEVIETYGSWKAQWTHRDTFIIDPDGNIAKEYRGVDPENHIIQIIDDLKSLQAKG